MAEENLDEVIEKIKTLGCWYVRLTKKSKRQFYYGTTGDTSNPVTFSQFGSFFGRTPLLARGEGSTDAKGTIYVTGNSLAARSHAARYRYGKPVVPEFIPRGKRRCLWKNCKTEITPKHAGEWYCAKCRVHRDAADNTKTHKIYGVR